MPETKPKSPVRPLNGRVIIISSAIACVVCGILGYLITAELIARRNAAAPAAAETVPAPPVSEPAPTAPEPAPPATATLTGTVTYRQRIALPPEALVVVRLEDTSLADAPAVPVAETSFSADGRQVPLPFAITYAPASIKAEHSYSVRASIEIDGELRWTSTTAYHVLTRGNPSQVDIVVDQVNAVPPEPPANATRLRDTEWMLVEFDGRSVPPPVDGGRAPMIVFQNEGSSVSAQGHCNRHFGSFEADDAAGTLVIRLIGSTRMGCPEPVMAEEAEFLAALGRVATFRIEGEPLTLEGGNAVAKFAAIFANK